MDRLKRARGTCRAVISRTINGIEAVLVTEEPDRDTLVERRERLEELKEQLVELDQKAMDKLMDENATDEQFEEESITIEDYLTKITRTRIAIDKVLNPRAVSPTCDSVHSAISGSATTEKKRNFKLPKVELKKFSGDIKEWLGWWSQFKKIDEDDTLHATDKFQYLLQALVSGTEARELVNSYPQSAENYPKAIKALKERFGEEGLLVQVYVRELLKLVITNVTQKERISLGMMHIKLESYLRALESLNLSTADPSTWLFPLVESSLPEDVLRAWQRSPLSKQNGKSENPPRTHLDYLMEFIKQEVKGEQRIELAQTGFEEKTGKEKNMKKSSQIKEHKKSREDNFTAAGLFSGHNLACIFCDKPHDSQSCGRALDLTIEDKNNKIKNKNACFLCLKVGHGSKKCKSFVKCIVCKKRHVTLMCPQVNKKPELKIEEQVIPTQSNLNCTNQVMLQTLNVVVSSANRQKTIRALCDPGAQKSYIKTRTSEELKLKPYGEVKLCHFLFGGSSEIKTHKEYQVQLRNTNGENTTMEVLDQKNICGTIPRLTKGPWMQELNKKQIYVPDIGPGSPEIELLIGSDYYGKILTGNRLELKNGLVALETKFGWTLSGKIKDESHVAMSVVSMHVQHADISKLWDLEIIGIQEPSEHRSRQERDDDTKAHFINTVSRSEDGRYCVRLPWINEIPTIPSNRKIAEIRLLNTTRKLKEKDAYNTYNSIFEGWLTEGIIEVVNGDTLDTGNQHYLPHRPVFKPESVTTPVRPVFDASCKSKRTPSLNDCLQKGPNLMELIPSVLLRFREHKIGVVSDIRKAFQMIDVDDRDRDFLRFLWWEDSNNTSLKVFRHRRVVFGVNSSPFLLAAVLEKHLNDVSECDSAIAKKLMKSLYVDNCVTSVRSLEEYQVFKQKATELLSDARMELRQWERGAVEVPEIDLPGASEGELESGISSFTKEKAVCSVLGLVWNKTNDSIGCDIPVIQFPVELTKRKILSIVQQIFDPIGFTAPATLIPKLILQEAWAAEVDWDETLNDNLMRRVMEWVKELDHLSYIKIPRCMNQFNRPECELNLHIFSDASKDAFASVVFLRIEQGNNVAVRFIQAKARIAPLKHTKDKTGTRIERRTSIPRLELLAAVIGARLAHTTKSAMEWDQISCTYWSDSTTTLAWIKRNNEWGTFVGNRVKEILKLTSSDEWRHIPGKLNPADLPSRGCSPGQLLESQWWEGPEWLKLSCEHWPINNEETDEEKVNTERKKVTRTFLGLSQTPWSTPRFSEYLKNIRIMGWVLRFIKNARSCPGQRKSQKDLNINEIRKAEHEVLKYVQSECFSAGTEDIKSLKVVDKSGLLCVVTKLIYKTDTNSFKYPILLPKRHPLVEQLIRFIHRTSCHAGTQFVLGKIREKYWIPQGRKAVSKVILECQTCKRYSSKKSEVEFAPLPRNRVETTEAYQTTGVDLAGPLYTRGGGKVWIVLFTCAVYRSIHLDLVNGLSTESFIGALERFICKNGRPNTIYSDNGTNFVGAVNIFKEINWAEIQDQSQVKQIRWIFNPPSAAWWGGWWERLIRSTKDLLRRMLGRAKLDYDELRTCLAAVESTINSRPLTKLTEDVDDLIPLTPAMFTRGIQDSSFPEGEEITSRELQNRYNKMKRLKKDLQNRFRQEYLGLLVQKSSEKNIKPLQVGSIVLVGADNKKRFEWPLGRVVELLPGKDKHTRVARVKTLNGILIRPLQRLYSLEIPNPDEFLVPREVKKFAVKQKNQDVLEQETQEIKTKSGRKINRPKRYGQWNI